MKKLFLTILTIISAQSLMCQENPEKTYAFFESETNLAIEKNDFEKLSLMTKENPEAAKLFSNQFFSQTDNKFMNELEEMIKSQKNLEKSLYIKQLTKKLIFAGTTIGTILLAGFWVKSYKNSKKLKATLDDAVRSRAARPDIYATDVMRDSCRTASTQVLNARKTAYDNYNKASKAEGSLGLSLICSTFFSWFTYQAKDLKTATELVQEFTLDNISEKIETKIKILNLLKLN